MHMCVAQAANEEATAVTPEQLTLAASSEVSPQSPHPSPGLGSTTSLRILTHYSL